MNDMKSFFPFLFCVFLSQGIAAQSENTKSLNVFVRCSSWCYTDYLKTEITHQIRAETGEGRIRIPVDF